MRAVPLNLFVIPSRLDENSKESLKRPREEETGVDPEPEVDDATKWMTPSERKFFLVQEQRVSLSLLHSTDSLVETQTN